MPLPPAADIQQKDATSRSSKKPYRTIHSVFSTIKLQRIDRMGLGEKQREEGERGRGEGKRGEEERKRGRRGHLTG